MTGPVLGRDPFERTARVTSPPPPSPPEESRDEVAATAASPAAELLDEPVARTRPRRSRALPSRAEEAVAGRARARRAALSTASRKAVAGVVREAQAARRARVHGGQDSASVPAPGAARPLDPAVDNDHIDLFGMSAAAVARAEPALRFLHDEYFRVQAEGIAQVPAHGRALVVANHAGSLPLDALMLMTGLRRAQRNGRQVRALVEDAIWHAPFVGMGMSRLGGVRADQDNAERLLREDQLVVVFPEGQKGLGKLYRDRYQLQRFGRGGFVKLAMRTGSPIVPAAVVGSEEIYPLLYKITRLVRTLGVPYIPITPTFPWLGALGLVPLPSKWRVQYGEPIDMARYGEVDCQDVALVNRLTEQVRERIQDMVNGMLATRESVLFG